MPHRDPLSAAVTMRERLKDELSTLEGCIAATVTIGETLDDVVRDVARIEQRLRVLRARAARLEAERDLTSEEESAGCFAIGDELGDALESRADGPISQPPSVTSRRASSIVFGLALACLTAGVVASVVDGVCSVVSKPSLAASPLAPSLRIDEDRARWNHLVAVVVESTGAPGAARDDRCGVEIRTGSPQCCDVWVVCPGVERRFHAEHCTTADGRLRAQISGALDFDGERGTIVLTMPEGTATLRFVDRQ
jgi:hypothetical protein